MGLLLFIQNFLSSKQAYLLVDFLRLFGLFFSTVLGCKHRFISCRYSAKRVNNIPLINLVSKSIYYEIDGILVASSKFGQRQLVMKN